MKTAADMLEEAMQAAPTFNHQLPTPNVVEATDDIINLSEPFTLQLPPVNSDAYSDVLLVFVNADGSYSPQALIHTQAVINAPAEGTVDNRKLSPPFDRDQSAVVQCFIRLRQTEIWQRTPDSVIYSF
jgi:hypothetical protein